MTAANIILTPSWGALLSDTAFYDGTGIIRRLSRKIAVLDRCNAVTVIRGIGNVPAQVEKDFGEVEKLSDLLEALPDYCREIYRSARPSSRFFGLHDGAAKVEMSVVAWDEWHGKPVFFCLSSHPDEDGPLEGAGAEPYEVRECGICSLSPLPSEQMETVLGKPLASREDVFALDPEIDGLKIMEAQRRTLVTVPGIQEPIPTVGGSCDLAMVSAAGISVKTLKTWPDEIGSHAGVKP
ncbi:hypothetical protein E2A64_05585 [Pseudohoeflea suaedae]|uniref:Uncharacterized protein n=1 Tax=Pseudohoeflea suaedae TaxID=877384 RepID=A0A4R5PNZ9_9HYPH|nr:hypothetical protein [Pseudohoeflea suaedae]TDH38573.1 hypothetical protein E2A64_05585 [Pseudohoeflea suaedae]